MYEADVLSETFETNKDDEKGKQKILCKQ